MGSPVFEKKLADWLQKISSDEIVPKDIQALNFGIFENPSGYTVYLIGAKQYDCDDDDWACDEDFVPKSKYLEIEQLDICDLSWEAFLDLMFESLKNILDNDGSNLDLLNVEHITTGFDDGDLVKVK